MSGEERGAPERQVTSGFRKAYQRGISAPHGVLECQIVAHFAFLFVRLESSGLGLGSKSDRFG